MKGAVWSTTIAEGNKMLEQIIKNYNQYGIHVSSERVSLTNGSSVSFNNGDCWSVHRASDCSRGVRCNVAYIQRNISLNVYHTIIGPTIFDVPFSAIRLWGEGDLHISDEPLLPF